MSRRANAPRFDNPPKKVWKDHPRALRTFASRALSHPELRFRAHRAATKTQLAGAGSETRAVSGAGGQAVYGRRGEDCFRGQARHAYQGGAFAQDGWAYVQAAGRDL